MIWSRVLAVGLVCAGIFCLAQKPSARPGPDSNYNVKIAGGGGIVTIFTTAQSGADSGEGTQSWRELIAITGGAATQIRVTFVASSAGNLGLDHASVGISNGTNYQTTATPTELLFTGASGFNIAANASITSDWLTFAGFTAADKLVVPCDMTAALGNPAFVTVTGNTNFFGAPGTAPSYNQATPAGTYGTGANQTAMVSKIEVQ